MHNLILQPVIHFLSVSQRIFLCYTTLRVGNVFQSQLSLKNMEAGEYDMIYLSVSISMAFLRCHTNLEATALVPFRKI